MYPYFTRIFEEIKYSNQNVFYGSKWNEYVASSSSKIDTYLYFDSSGKQERKSNDLSMNWMCVFIDVWTRKLFPIQQIVKQTKCIYCFTTTTNQSISYGIRHGTTNSGCRPYAIVSVRPNFKLSLTFTSAIKQEAAVLAVWIRVQRLYLAGRVSTPAWSDSFFSRLSQQPTDHHTTQVLTRDRKECIARR